MPYAGHAYDMVGAGYTMMANADYKPNEIMNKFKVGDRVHLQPKCKDSWFLGKIGTVDRVDSSSVVVRLDCDGLTYAFHPAEVGLISSPTSAFKVGDRVMVECGIVNPALNHNGAQFNNRTGKIHHVGKYIGVIFDCNSRSYDFLPEELQLLSPPSPQPQTTEPKEDTMKPYAVIYHDLNTGGPAQIQSHHTTQEEAKESAELLIAGQRANKRHFAVTIVNTKTGKLVGSVVDAPPAVDWKTE